MELTAQQALPVGQTQAWEALNDIDLLKEAIPGCDSFVQTAEHQYEVGVTAAIGPVKARFKGQLKLEELQAPVGYTLQFSGQGGPAGHAKGQARIRLEPQGPRQTLLHYTATASVGGKIAQLGSRLIDMAAQKMAADFFARFNEALQQRYGVTAEETAEPAGSDAAGALPSSDAGVFGRLLSWLRRLFGGR